MLVFFHLCDGWDFLKQSKLPPSAPPPAAPPTTPRSGYGLKEIYIYTTKMWREVRECVEASNLCSQAVNASDVFACVGACVRVCTHTQVQPVQRLFPARLSCSCQAPSERDSNEFYQASQPECGMYCNTVWLSAQEPSVGQWHTHTAPVHATLSPIDNSSTLSVYCKMNQQWREKKHLILTFTLKVFSLLKYFLILG